MLFPKDQRQMKIFRDEDQALHLMVSFVYIVLPIIFLWPWFTGDGYLSGDFLRMYYPEYIHLTNRLSSFDLPMWDPTSLTGVPTLAAFPKFFYPFTLLLGLAGIAIDDSRVFLLLIQIIHGPFHLTLAGLFTYWLCNKSLKLQKTSSFLAGLVFMFSGLLVGSLSSELPAMIWPPLIIHHFIQGCVNFDNRRRSVALGGLSLGVCVLAGYPTIPIGTIFLIFWLGCYGTLLTKTLPGCNLKDWVAVFIGMLVIGVALAAVQLIPTLHFLPFSHRPSFDYFTSSQGVPTVSAILQMVFPLWMNSESIGPEFAPHLYVGVPVIILVGLGATAGSHISKFACGGFLIAGLVFLALSFGHHFFLHAFAYFTVPLFDLNRHPINFFPFASLSMGVLVGLGWQAVTRSNIEKPSRHLITLLLFISIFLVLLAFSKTNSLNIRDCATCDTSIYVALTSSLFALVLWKIPSASDKLRIFVAVCILIAVDILSVFSAPTLRDGLWALARQTNPVAFYKSNEVYAALYEELSEERFLSLSIDGAALYSSATHDIPMVFSHRPILPHRLKIMRDELMGSTNAALFRDVLGVRYVVSFESYSKVEALADPSIVRDRTLARSGSDPVFFFNRNWQPTDSDLKEFELFRNTDVLAMYRIVNEIHMDEDSNAIEQNIRHSEIEELGAKLAAVDLRKVAFVEAADLSKETRLQLESVGPGASTPSVSLVTHKPESVVLRVVVDRPSILIANVTYLPGWTALVNGIPTEILRTNFLTQSIFLRSGEHDVEFRYRTPGLYLGAAITLLGLLIFMYLYRPAILGIHSLMRIR